MDGAGAGGGTQETYTQENPYSGIRREDPDFTQWLKPQGTANADRVTMTPLK